MIKSLKLDQAVGVDDITSVMRKAASSLYVQHLTEVFNESYRVGRVSELGKLP